jgi:polyhydroxyalkanoate synthesis regulator phasin
MTLNGLKAVTLLSSLLMLTACTGPETPQEVTKAFWESVRENDADDIVELSTLVDPGGYKGMGSDWQAANISLGRTVIEGREAKVVTVFRSGEDAAKEGREVVTYLIRQGDEWRVNYKPTADAFAARSALHRFVGELGRLGDEISAGFSRSSEVLVERMDEMAGEIRALSDSATEQANEALEQYSNRLSEHIEELMESLEEALKDKKQASLQDRELLETSVRDLNAESERLEDPDLESVASSSTTVAETRIRLRDLDQDVFSEYQKEWEKWMKEIEQDVNDLIDEINANSH